MPDWSYHPLFRPLLWRLPPERARAVTLGAVGKLVERPGGTALFDFMGHMRPAPQLQRTAWGITFPSPVGGAAGLDPHATATQALARFGFGFLELGPVTCDPVYSSTPVERDRERQALLYPDLPVNDGVAALRARLQQISSVPVPLGVRLAHRPGASAMEATVERIHLLSQLAPFAAFFSIDTDAVVAGAWSVHAWQDHLAQLQQHAAPRPLLIAVAPDTDTKVADALVDRALGLGITGVIVGSGVRTPDGRRMVGVPVHAHSRDLIQHLHARWGSRLTIVGGGGVHAGQQALDLLRAGATLVQVQSGLIYAGPGLPKRINEAVFHTETKSPAVQWTNRVPPWVWTLLLGIGMIVGGVLAWLVAATRVVLPYDEAFIGLARGDLVAANPRLLAFMAHDRVSLAGTMVSIGVLYAQLAAHALRHGVHWAWRTVTVSASVGFGSFFLFLGFGYLDPLHALVSLLLLPLFLFGVRGRFAAAADVPVPDLHNDGRWRRGYWAQLLFIALGVGIISAGGAIAAVGVTRVFVPQDLAFMQTTFAALCAANDRLVPLVAHDRAGFGGALVSSGLGVLLMSLWGFRRGARWVWWTYLLAGAPAFAAAIGVHFVVGYIDTIHLAPAVLGALVYVVALVLAHGYLCDTRSAAASSRKPYASRERRAIRTMPHHFFHGKS